MSELVPTISGQMKLIAELMMPLVAQYHLIQLVGSCLPVVVVDPRAVPKAELDAPVPIVLEDDRFMALQLVQTNRIPPTAAHHV